MTKISKKNRGRPKKMTVSEIHEFYKNIISEREEYWQKKANSKWLEGHKAGVDRCKKELEKIITIK